MRDFNRKTSIELLVSMTALLIISIVLSSFEAYGQSSSVNSKRDIVLWYKQPGVKWLEGLPLGNGMIGAMVFGGVPEERIALNEGTFWSGRPHDYDSVS